MDQRRDETEKDEKESTELGKNERFLKGAIEYKIESEVKKDENRACDRDLFEIKDGKLVDFDDSRYRSRYGENLPEVTIPADVAIIGRKAFMGSSVTGVRFSEKVETLEFEAFAECHNLESVFIPAGVRSIGNYAFCRCGSLKEVVIGDGVGFIGEGAFMECPMLESVRLPRGIGSIEAGTFRFCQSLKYVEIPDGVKTVGDEAFAIDSRLEKINVPKSVRDISRSAFICTIRLRDICVDSGNEAYAAVGGNLYTKDGKTLVMVRRDATSIDIPNDVTAISEYAFDVCQRLKYIEIPQGVAIIQKNTFTYCTNLKRVKFSGGVIAIERGTFSHCQILESIDIPSTVIRIEGGVFERCGSIKYVKFEDPENWVCPGDDGGFEDIATAFVRDDRKMGSFFAGKGGKTGVRKKVADSKSG